MAWRTKTEMIKAETKKRRRSAGNWKPHTTRPPLVYIGGKSRGVAQIVEQFPSRLTEMVCSFIGGGSVEVHMALRGVRVHGYDAEPALACFWKYLLKDGRRVHEAAKQFYPIKAGESGKYLDLRRKLIEMPDSLERAGLYYAVNRSAWGGGTLCNTLSHKTINFTGRSMHNLSAFRAPNLTVEAADFQVSLARHLDTFAYLDPPYLMKIKGTGYYGEKGHLHRYFDHEGLARLLAKRGLWIMSNHDCEEVRDLYAGHRMISPAWSYGLPGDRASQELLIFSRDLQPSRTA